jgi:RNA polymerase primary sigma factor
LARGHFQQITKERREDKVRSVVNYTLWGKPQENRALLNEHQCGSDSIETTTGSWHTAEDSEETTSLLEDRESFGHEGPLEDRPEEVDDDELTDHVQQYMRQLAKTPLLTGEGEQEVALRIEEARRELEGIGLSLPFAAQDLLNILSRSKTVSDPWDGGKSDEWVIATLESLKQAHDQSERTESREQRDRYGAEMRRLIAEMNGGNGLVEPKRSRCAQRIGEKAGIPTAELKQLLERIKRAKKQYVEARNLLTKANLRLVVAIAKKYMNRGLSFPDLVQEGNVGLMKAAEKFDGRMGYRFSTYAVWWIRQAIRRAIKEQTRTIHIPANMIETVQRVARVSHNLARDLGREPFPNEIAGEMGLSVKKIREVLHITHEPISLETPAGDEGAHLVDLLEDKNAAGPQDPALFHDLVEGLNKALSTLTAREEKLIRMRFGIGETSHHTLEELAQTFGLTRERVRQIEGKALSKLRHHAGAWEG